MKSLRERLKDEEIVDFVVWWLRNVCPKDIRVVGGNSTHKDWHQDINDMVQDDDELEELYARFLVEEE